MKQRGSELWIVAIRILLLTGICVFIPSVGVQAAEKNIALGSAGQDYDTQLTMLVGDTGTFSLDAADPLTDFYMLLAQDLILSVQYSCEDKNILSVSEDGIYSALAAGETTLELAIRTADDIYLFRYYIEVNPDLSQAVLSQNSLEVYFYHDLYDDVFETDIEILGAIGLTEESAPKLEYHSSNIGVHCKLNGTKIHVAVGRIVAKTDAFVLNAGTTWITLSMGNKTWQVKLVIHEVRLSGANSLCLVKGKTKKLKVTGISGKPRWISSNPKAVKISKDGVIRAKKEGNAIITAKIGSGQVGCVVSVVSKKRKRMLNTAIKIGKTCQYSQARRMESGYYDCSSLVWKAYKKMNINFGNRNYAPVAADNAKWCARHHKIVKGNAAKNVQKLKYLPGALLYKTGEMNDRYKGIYHVEMFSGYSFYGFDRQGKARVGLKWVNRTEYYEPTGLWAQP